MSESMGLTYKLSAYEGPLDLLYRLIQLNKIDIFDIPISELAEQYLGFLEKADARDMDSMSEFSLMAATLLEIKSKLLLPKAPSEEEDPRKLLVDSLLEYRRAKLAAELLVALEDENDRCFFKSPQQDLIEALKPRETVEDVLEGVTLWSLFRVFNEVMAKKEYKTDKIRSTFNSVRKDKFTVENKAERILELLRTRGRLLFRALITGAGKMEAVVTFLALLELIKANEIAASQSGAFGEIEILPWRREMRDTK